MVHALLMARRRRQRIHNTIMILMIARRNRVVRILLILQLLLLRLLALRSTVSIEPSGRRRSCRRVTRNTGWWDIAWSTYSEKDLKGRSE